jgi:uncharacterized DUF497 family protein
MIFDWDPAKDASNRVKHGVSFETAQLVFDDPHAISTVDRVVGGEVRWKTTGVLGGRLLVIAHTLDHHGHEEFIRIISARKATALEKRRYEEAP